MSFTTTFLSSNTGSGTSLASDSHTPASNALMLCAVVQWREAASMTTATLSGQGLTWVKIAETSWTASGTRQQRTTLFRAQGASPSTGVVTATCAESNDAITLILCQVTGTATTGTNGSGAVTNVVSANVSAGTSVSATYGATTGGSMSFAAVGHATGVTTEGFGWTELQDVATGGACIETQYKDPHDTTCSASWASAVNGGIVGIEILSGGTARTLDGKAAIASKAKATRYSPKAFAAKAATAFTQHFNRVPHAHVGVPVGLQAKVPTGDSGRAVMVIPKLIAGKLGAASKAKAVFIKIRKMAAKVGQSSNAKSTLSTTTSTGNPPAIPADVTAGPAATTLIGWGGAGLPYASVASLTSWRDNYGHGGFGVGGDFPEGALGGPSWQGASACGSVGSQWGTQQKVEACPATGIANGGVLNALNTLGMTGWLQLRLQSSYNNNGNPGGSVSAFSLNGTSDGWFDDAMWTNTILPGMTRMAQAASFLGARGIQFDLEPYYNKKWVWDYAQRFGKTEAQIRAQVTLRGQQAMQAYVNGFPGIEFLVYSWKPPGSWDDILQVFSNGGTLATAANNWTSTNNGSNVQWNWFDGMSSVQGYGAIRIVDATFYKGPQIGGSDNEAALKFNVNQWMSFLSQRMSNWNYAASRMFVSPFSWIDEDVCNEGDYAADRGANFTAAQLALHRKWSMQVHANFQFHSFGELSGYNYPNPPNIPVPANQGCQVAVVGHSTCYQPGVSHLPGMAAVRVAGNVDTSVPVVGTVFQNRVANTVTLTFTAQHAMGIRRVHWTLYAANGSTVLNQGEATMACVNDTTVTVSTGSLTMPIPYQCHMNCTGVVPGATSGLYVILDAYSIKDQRHSVRVQMT